MNPTKSINRRAFSTSGLAGLAALMLAGRSFGQTPAAFGRFESADEEKANVKVVEEFCAAWATKDLDKITGLLADDCSFRPSGRSAPVAGKEKVVARFKGDFDRAKFELKILKSAVLGPVVLTQRVDIIAALGGTPPRNIQIAGGMFFVENGKIVEWTDFSVK